VWGYSWGRLRLNEKMQGKGVSEEGLNARKGGRRRTWAGGDEGRKLGSGVEKNRHARLKPEKRTGEKSTLKTDVERNGDRGKRTEGKKVGVNKRVGACSIQPY